MKNVLMHGREKEFRGLEHAYKNKYFYQSYTTALWTVLQQKYYECFLL